MFKSINELIQTCEKHIFKNKHIGVYITKREKVLRGISLEEFNKILSNYNMKCVIDFTTCPSSHDWFVCNIDLIPDWIPTSQN